MSHKFRYALLFVGIYLLSLVAMLPANYVVKQLESRTTQLTTHGVTGTLWSGEIQLLETEVASLENVQWTLSPLALLYGQLELNFLSVSSEQSFEGRAQLSLLDNGLSLSDLRVRFPVALYEQQLGLKGLELSGQLELQLAQLDIHDGRCSVAALVA